MMERRTIKAELRKMGEDTRKLSGVAIVFNKQSDNLGGFREVIDPNALVGCDMSDVRCLINHEDNLVLGRTVSGTLTLSVDDNGCSFECDPPDTSYARDLAACMDRGDIDQCSFAFSTAPGGVSWSQDADGTDIRTVTTIAKLFDVSIVTYPAYPQTSSEIRSNADILAEKPKQEPEPTGPATDYKVELDLLRHKLDLEFYSNQ